MSTQLIDYTEYQAKTGSRGRQTKGFRVGRPGPQITTQSLHQRMLKERNNLAKGWVQRLKPTSEFGLRNKRKKAQDKAVARERHTRSFDPDGWQVYDGELWWLTSVEWMCDVEHGKYLAENYPRDVVGRDRDGTPNRIIIDTEECGREQGWGKPVVPY